MHHGSLSVSQSAPGRRAVDQDRRVVGEPGDDVAVRPAAGVLERLRQVPVVEREPGIDPALEQPVDQPVVEVQALGFAGPRPVGLDARPGDEKR